MTQLSLNNGRMGSFIRILTGICSKKEAGVNERMTLDE